MKKLLLSLFAITLLINLNAQDIVIKKNGDEFKAKVLEVGSDEVKYKKFENIDGPTYTIQKNEIFMIRYENGHKDVFNKKEENSTEKKQAKSEHFRKGLHLGMHVTPGVGAVLGLQEYKFGFSSSTGIDLNIYFTDYIGIKTGVTYQNLAINYTEYYYNYNYGYNYGYFNSSEVSGSVSSLAIPVKFLLTTGKKVGFYLESGFNFSFPIATNLENNFGQSASGGHEPFVIAAESVFGLNIKASNLISLNFGLSTHYSLMKYFPNEDSKGLLVGLQVGMLFKLSK